MSGYKLLLIMVIAAVAFTTSLAQQPKVKGTPARPTSAESGKAMFVAYCASCHGRDGKGNGPAAAAMKVAPSDLTTLSRKNKGTFPASHVAAMLSGKEEVVAHGSSEMPVWGPIFRRMGHGDEAEVQQRITNLTEYIESLQAK